MFKKDFKESLNAGIPLFIGYVPAAIAFGILSKVTGISLLESFLFSSVVFAGASQFMALNLLVTGMSFSGIILTTLLVNFRHFLMSAYISTKLEKQSKKYIPLIAFGITDEVFSVLSFRPGKLSKTNIFVLELSAYSGWIIGTLSGYILGSFMPEMVTKSMGIALYALFVAILLPEIKKSYRALVLALASGVLNMLLIYLDILPKGWTIIFCILFVAGFGAFFFNEDEQEATNA